MDPSNPFFSGQPAPLTSVSPQNSDPNGGAAPNLPALPQLPTLPQAPQQQHPQQQFNAQQQAAQQHAAQQQYYMQQQYAQQYAARQQYAQQQYARQQYAQQYGGQQVPQQQQQQMSPAMDPTNPFFAAQAGPPKSHSAFNLNHGATNPNSNAMPSLPSGPRPQSASVFSMQQHHHSKTFQMGNSQGVQPQMLKRESAPTFQQGQMQQFQQQPVQQPQFNKAQSNAFYPAANNPFNPQMPLHQQQHSGQSEHSNNPFFPSNPAQPALHEPTKHIVPPPPAGPHPDDAIQSDAVQSDALKSNVVQSNVVQSNAVQSNAQRSPNGALMPSPNPHAPKPIERQISEQSREIHDDALRKLQESLPEEEKVELSPEEKAAAKEEKRKRNRVRAVDELISTEVTYIKKLLMLNKLYRDPMMKDTKLLKPQHHPVLFPPVLGTILELNKKLLNSMRGNKERIGKALHDFIPFMKMYQSYMNSHGATSQLIKQLRMERNSEFCKYLLDKEVQEKGFTLESYLILPIQRMPRYELCLREIIKLTHDDHPDKCDLQTSYDKIAAVNKQINAAISDYETRQKVRDIAVRIVDSSYHSHDKVKPQRNKTRYNLFGGGKSGNKRESDTASSSAMFGGGAAVIPEHEGLVQPSRVFILEGHLTKVSQKKDIKYLFVLFNDLLIYCSERPDHKLVLHRKINIGDEFFRIESAIILDDDDNSGKGGGGKGKNKRANTFEIHSIEKSFLCYADSAEEREQWIEAIGKCVSQLRSSGIEKRASAVGRGRSASEAQRTLSPSSRSVAFKQSQSVERPLSSDMQTNEVDEGRILETAPIWIPNDWTDECMMPQCSNKFSAILLKKRNHCRYCGKLMCSDCATHTLPHYEPSKRKSQVHVKVCDLCHEKYKAKPLMNLDQLNALAKQMNEDSKSAKNHSVQIDDDLDSDSDEDDWNVDSMYSTAPQSTSGPSYGSPGGASNIHFGSYESARNEQFEKPLPQSHTPVVHANGALSNSLGGDDLGHFFNGNSPRMQQSQSQHNPALNHLMHSQSVMQLHGQQQLQQRVGWQPPHSQQHHGHSLTGFMRQSNKQQQGGLPLNGMMASSNSNSSGLRVDMAVDDVFGNLPDDDVPLPGTPEEHKKVGGAFNVVDQMMSANAMDNLGAAALPHAQSDSFGDAVVLDDNVEVQDLSDSDEFASNFANINIPVKMGNEAAEQALPRQSTNEVLYPFMEDGQKKKKEEEVVEAQLDHNHAHVQQLGMFGFSKEQVEAAWKMMKGHDKDKSIVPDHGPLFVQTMLDYLNRVQKDVSRNSILGAYKQSNSNSYYNAFGGGL